MYSETEFKGVDSMEYFHQLTLHCIKRYGILIVLGGYLPFVGALILSG